MPHSIVCSELAFDWPDGTPVFSGLNAAFDTGRTGLIGLNGSGKSTLLKLITGRLTPASGSVRVDGDIGCLEQRVTLDTGQSVAELLGIAPVRTALRAIESGDASEDNFAAVGDDWDIEERAAAELERFGIVLGDDPLDRTVASLSGGEAVLTGLAGLILRRPAVTLLDEPTNNLDARARALLYEAVETWRGVLVVVTHDRELLERVDRIAELREGRIRIWGGNYSAYTEQLAAEQEAAQRAVRTAAAGVRRERRQLIEAQTKLDRRARYGRKMNAIKREPKVVMNQRRGDAQVSAAKHHIMHAGKVEEAEQALAESEAAVRDDDRIRIRLPETAVPAGRTMLELDGPHGRSYVRGPERIALTGDNGTGKTTLLRAITGSGAHPAVTVARVADRVGYLPQRLDILDDSLSVLDNVRAAAPSAAPQRVRADLARFLVRGDRLSDAAGVLSGGERFRVTLACLLLADPPPQLLLLDEPTNNLDLDSVGRLTEALAAYRGALIVAGHDTAFLADIGITRWWRMERGGAPVEADPPPSAGG
ncbi:ABC-F family ATP-binding cassette domain-containing protein [Streptomonospora sp. PA3]|uniref:ABC-F family ATP-binding cassette domain-containing protein n=1 Tax=Streptomonospora sp. PA3 TaxID=2607326 RepID=UPI0012DFDC9A|nr:ABC-F family ATP-binding cassette domain-containing protein [Streptomonospora sp. PA3]MUL41191.1 ABC-F family ATP-binding cassette domain-containing protein [Streptomonospora sp. PA3]